MEKKDRTTEAYGVHLLSRIDGKKYSDEPILSDFFAYLFKEWYNSNDMLDCLRHKDLKYKLNKFDIDDNIISLCFNYYRYNQKVDIVNTDTQKKTKSKDKKEADELRQHLVIKLLNDSDNSAIIVYEKITNGIPFSELRYAIETKYKSYSDTKTSIEIKKLANKDFIDELMKLRRVKALEITCDIEKQNLSANNMFSQNGNIARERTTITYKPPKLESLDIKAIKAEYEKIANGLSNSGIFRLRVIGDGPDGEARINSDASVFKKRVSLLLDSSGQIDTDNTFMIYKTFVENIDENLCNILVED